MNFKRERHHLKPVTPGHLLSVFQDVAVICPLLQLLLHSTLEDDYIKKNYLFIFLFGCAGSSLLYSLFSSCVERGLLPSCGAWASHHGEWAQVEHRLKDTRASAVVAPGLYSAGSIVVVHGLSYSAACRTLLDQGSNLYCVGKWILYHSHQGRARGQLSFPVLSVWFQEGRKISPRA